MRISKDDEDNPSLSPDVQEQQCVDYCRLWKLNLVEILVDRAVSGAVALEDRRGGAKLMDWLKVPGRYVVAARQDRLFRDSADAISTMKIWLHIGIVPVCIAEGLDLSTPAGRLMFTIMAGMAQYEREIIGVRTRAVLQAKRSRGERVSKYAPFGFQLAPNGKKASDGRELFDVVPNATERLEIAAMKADRNAGKSFREIAAKLNEKGVKTRKGEAWAHTTVRKILNEWKGINPLKQSNQGGEFAEE